MSRAASRGKGGGSGPFLLTVSAAPIACSLLPNLPPGWLLALLLGSGAILACVARLRLAGLFMISAALCLFAYHLRIEDRLEPALAGSTSVVQGVVTSIPQNQGDLLRFRFRPDSSIHPELPGTLRISWYRDWPDVRAGQRWKLDLRLKPPWGVVNFHGPDRERWLFSEGIGAFGSVREGVLLENRSVPGFPVQKLRAELLLAIERQVDDARQKGVVQALATADRSGIAPEENDLLRVSGTAHLLAISGLHVGLAALGGMVVVRVLARLLPPIFRGRSLFHLVALGGAVTAVLYAMLANLGVSTVRALAMLIAALVVLGLARSINPFRAFVLALAVVLVSNPFAPLGSGFWFSFFAVLALMWVFQPRCSRFSWFETAVLAQSAVFLVLLPVNAAWLGGFSLAAFPANLVAIPWVSFLVVPPVLGGVAITAFSEPLAGGLWHLAGLSTDALLAFLQLLTALQAKLLPVRTLSPFLLGLAVAGALLLLLPRGVPARWTGLFLMLPLFLPAPSPAQPGGLRLDALDVGQGSAIAVSDERRTLLYDTGPGDGAGRDLVASAIVPLFSALGRSEPDLLFISHGDLDHTGGLLSARERFPGALLVGSVRDGQAGLRACRAGLNWQWDGLPLRVLHPAEGLPYLRNNSSCVLAVGNESVGVLLPGDIEGFVEKRLLLEGLGRFPVLMVPHHGSLSSSGEDFIDRVAPTVAIATAGLGNRFGFPREEVRNRYKARNSDIWSTGTCGGLRVEIDGQGRVTASSARRERRRIWRWPAAGECP